ncbi:unnamed protein product [Closterium sp. NIES-65]|nr:unnamed protein product [Closterium sp. NIES-65]
MVELASEAPTGYLSGLIKSKKAKTEIRKLSVSGQNITRAREVLEAATTFFRDTFAGPLQEVTEEGWEVAESKRLLDKDKEALTRPWSEDEVRTALRELPTGKAPGQDGLPKELFEQNWGLLGKEVMKLVEVFEKDALLPEPFMTAVTILLHKKGAREQLGNYRSITLLNVLYKLVAKVLANRIKKVLPQVILERQYGFIPGRRLADAVSTVADVIDAAPEGDEDWLLLLVDFQKTYDSVSRDFLFTTMEKMGFPGKFIAWTKGLHEGAGTKLMVNGWLGDRIGMEKGVRQGCPLAPYLFLCAAEPLCQEAERRGLGIRKRGVGGLTYVGYADDTTLALHGQEQVVAAKRLLDEFGLCSGLYINQEKTKLMPLGKNRRRQQPTDSPFQWAAQNEPERLLGIWVTSGGSPEPSWYKAFERMCSELSKWDSKHLTTSARVTIVNSYAMPIILFQALVYTPLHEIWLKVKRICHNFISKGKASFDRFFILWSFELSFKDRKEGGLRVISPKERLGSIAIHNIARGAATRDPFRNWLWEKAAGFPQGLATVYAHPAIMQHWMKGGVRWKATIEALWETKAEVIRETANRWEAEREFLLFNKAIFFRGKSPFGNQHGSDCLKGVTLGDLIKKGADGSRTVKDEATLERELGGEEQRKWAMKALEANPMAWKELVLKTLTADEVFGAAKLVRMNSYRPGEFFFYMLLYTSGNRLFGKRVTVEKDGCIKEVRFASATEIRWEGTMPIVELGGKSAIATPATGAPSAASGHAPAAAHPADHPTAPHADPLAAPCANPLTSHADPLTAPDADPLTAPHADPLTAPHADPLLAPPAATTAIRAAAATAVRATAIVSPRAASSRAHHTAAPTVRHAAACSGNLPTSPMEWGRG